MNLQKKRYLKNTPSQNFRFLFGILKKNLNFFFVAGVLSFFFLQKNNVNRSKHRGINPSANFLMNLITLHVKIF